MKTGKSEKTRRSEKAEPSGKAATAGKAGKPQGSDERDVSESERLLFGGPLRYDTGWNQHTDAFLELNFRAMITELPSSSPPVSGWPARPTRAPPGSCWSRRWAGA